MRKWGREPGQVDGEIDDDETRQDLEILQANPEAGDRERHGHNAGDPRPSMSSRTPCATAEERERQHDRNRCAASSARRVRRKMEPVVAATVAYAPRASAIQTCAAAPIIWASRRSAWRACSAKAKLGSTCSARANSSRASLRRPAARYADPR